MLLGVDLSPIIDAATAGLAGVITAALAALSAVITANWRKQVRAKKLCEAVDDAVNATNKVADVSGIKGDAKFQQCMAYTKALLSDEGVQPPPDLVLEAKIHAKLNRMSADTMSG